MTGADMKNNRINLRGGVLVVPQWVMVAISKVLSRPLE